MGAAPTCSCSRSRRLAVRLRSDKLPSALNPASGHYFDHARSLPAHPVQLGEMRWSSIRVLRPVFRFGRPACISQHLCSKVGVPCVGRTHLRGFADRCLGCSANETFGVSGRRAWPPPACSDIARHQCRRFRGSHRLASFSNSFLVLLVLVREFSGRSFALPKAVANRPSTPTLSINPNSFRTDASTARPANSFTGRNSLIACRTRT